MEIPRIAFSGPCFAQHTIALQTCSIPFNLEIIDKKKPVQIIDDIHNETDEL